MRGGNDRAGGQGGEIDVLLRGGSVLNVYTGELLEANVAISGDRIWYVGPRSDIGGDRTLVLDVGDRVLVPGYVEPHCHPWMIYNPLTFGEEACRLGTTTLVCDDLIFYVLMGLERFEAFMEALSHTPIKFYWSARAVPQTPMERENTLFSVANLKRLLRNPLVQSVGEITRWQEVVRGNARISKVIRFAHEVGKRVDGHTAGARYEPLNALGREGVQSCHESVKAGELLDRLRLGFHVMLRESSLRQDARELLRVLREHPLCAARSMLTTDGSTPAFLKEFGVTDHLLRVALEEGIDPAVAYRLVTLNPAVYFGLDDRVGAIAPGRYADILVLKDLLHPSPEAVISKGRIVAERGTLRAPFPGLNWGEFFPTSSPLGNGWRSTERLYRIPAGGSTGGTVRVPTIKLVSAAITRVEWVDFPVKDGFVDVSSRDGFCLVATLNREGRWVARGVLQGFGEMEGLASSFNTAAELVVVGRNPAAMSAAVDRVRHMNGGIVAVEDGRPSYSLPLPVGAVMSERPMADLAEKEVRLKELLQERGYPYHDPLFTLVFLPNDFLPEVRINRRGVVDIKKNEVLWPATQLPYPA